MRYTDIWNQSWPTDANSVRLLVKFCSQNTMNLLSFVSICFCCRQLGGIKRGIRSVELPQPAARRLASGGLGVVNELMLSTHRDSCSIRFRLRDRSLAGHGSVNCGLAHPVYELFGWTEAEVTSHNLAIVVCWPQQYRKDNGNHTARQQLVITTALCTFPDNSSRYNF